MSSYILYDIITQREWYPDRDGVIKTMTSIGLDYTNWCRMKSGAASHILGRYILKSNISKTTFTIAEVDTGEEYICITNATIFLHLGIPYNNNEAKYVYELRKGRQAHASIGGRVFHLLDGRDRRVMKPMKAHSDKIKSVLADKKLRYRVKLKLSKRIYDALLSAGTVKRKITTDLVGCSAYDLVEYLKSKFTPGMSLDNYGEWHVDHIIPCAHFNLLDEKEQLKAFHYSNLQPIWATTQIAKKYCQYEYVGNQNKHSRGDSLDYYLRELISPIISEFDGDTLKAATQIAIALHKAGVRKVIDPKD